MLTTQHASNCPGCSRPPRCQDKVQAALQKDVHTAVHAMISLACCQAVKLLQ